MFFDPFASADAPCEGRYAVIVNDCSSSGTGEATSVYITLRFLEGPRSGSTHAMILVPFEQSKKGFFHKALLTALVKSTVNRAIENPEDLVNCVCIATCSIHKYFSARKGKDVTVQNIDDFNEIAKDRLDELMRNSCERVARAFDDDTVPF